MLGATIPTERKWASRTQIHRTTLHQHLDLNSWSTPSSSLCHRESRKAQHVEQDTCQREGGSWKSLVPTPNPASCDVWYVKVKWLPSLNNSDQYRKIGFQMSKILAWNSGHEVLLPSLCVHPVLQYSTLLYVFIHAILSSRRVLCLIYVCQTPIKQSNFCYFR